MSEVKTIRLYGKLGARFGRVHELAVNSPAEAVQALCAMYPGFESHLTGSKDRGEGYLVFAGKKNLKEADLRSPVGENDIRIAPILIGSKKQGVGQIIMGIILVVVGVIYGYYTGDWATAAGWIVNGIGMIVGGVIQMLTPVPKKPDQRGDEEGSYVFNGPVNTQAQGNPVPVLYGRMIVGSAVISAGIVVDQIMSGGSYGGGAYPGGAPNPGGDGGFVYHAQ